MTPPRANPPTRAASAKPHGSAPCPASAKMQLPPSFQVPPLRSNSRPPFLMQLHETPGISASWGKKKRKKKNCPAPSAATPCPLGPPHEARASTRNRRCGLDEWVTEGMGAAATLQHGGRHHRLPPPCLGRRQRVRHPPSASRVVMLGPLSLVSSGALGPLQAGGGTHTISILAGGVQILGWSPDLPVSGGSSMAAGPQRHQGRIDLSLSPSLQMSGAPAQRISTRAGAPTRAGERGQPYPLSKYYRSQFLPDWVSLCLQSLTYR